MYQQLKNIYHWLQARLWQAYYRFPDKGMVLYGITGTNGKTTTSYILASILASYVGEEHVGMLTTVALRVGTVTETNSTKLTTLPSQKIYEYLKRMKDAGVTHVVLELTSHALDQNRAAGIALQGAIILNISPEHMNYHHTIEGITKAKGKIVHYLTPGGVLIGNGDDINVGHILDSADVAKVEVQRFTHAQAQHVETPLLGEANKENVLAASLLARAVDIPESTITEGVQNLKHVPGRMERVSKGQPFDIIIDYAVTPDALDRLYAFVRQQTPGKVLAVLGAAGLRDRDKRPEMARTVAEYADELVITREDPWTENEEQIFQDLESGLANVDIPWQRIVDRKEALRHVMKEAAAGDTVVVTGKGAEVGMAIGEKVVPYNERETIEDILQETP